MYYAFSNSADIIGVPKKETPCLTTFIYTKDTGVPLNFMKNSMSWKDNKKIEMPLNWMEIELYKNFPCSRY